MDKSQAPAIVLAIVLALIFIIAISVVILRGMGGYGKALKQFEDPEGEWPQEKWQKDLLRKQPGIPVPPPESPGPPTPIAPPASPAPPAQEAPGPVGPYR